MATVSTVSAIGALFAGAHPTANRVSDGVLVVVFVGGVVAASSIALVDRSRIVAGPRRGSARTLPVDDRRAAARSFSAPPAQPWETSATGGWWVRWLAASSPKPSSACTSGGSVSAWWLQSLLWRH